MDRFSGRELKGQQTAIMYHEDVALFLKMEYLLNIYMCAVYTAAWYK